MNLRFVGTMLIAIGAFAIPAFSAEPLPRAPGKPTYVPPPAAPGTTAQPFNGGVIVREPGKPPQLVVPQNRNDAGKADIKCQKVSEATYRCR